LATQPVEAKPQFEKRFTLELPDPFLAELEDARHRLQGELRSVLHSEPTLEDVPLPGRQRAESLLQDPVDLFPLYVALLAKRGLGIRDERLERFPRALFAAEADSDRCRFQPMACREVGPFAQRLILAF